MKNRMFGFAVLGMLAIGLMFGAGNASAQSTVPALVWSNQLQQEPATQVQAFVGTIAKNQDNQFVLQVSEEEVYALDNQGEAAKFEGKKVKVTGVLDPQTGRIQMQSIEPAQ